MLIEVNGITLYYEVSGRGAPLILLHGNGETHAVFDELSKKLSEDFTVYAIDSRDHGQSEKTGAVSYEAMAADVLSFIDALDLKKPALLGFSDGGITGLMAAMARPEAFSRLAICGANLFPEGIKARYLRLFKLIYALTKKPLIGLMINAPHIEAAELKKIDIPTLVLAGEKDMIREDHTELIARSLPQAQLMILPGETHGSYVVHTNKLYPVLESFLGRVNALLSELTQMGGSDEAAEAEAAAPAAENVTAEAKAAAGAASAEPTATDAGAVETADPGTAAMGAADFQGPRAEPFLRGWKKWAGLAAAALVLIAFAVYYILGGSAFLERRAARKEAEEAAGREDYTLASQLAAQAGAEEERLAYGYQAAMALFDQGAFYDAANAFNALGNYQDAQVMVSESLYQEGRRLLELGERDAARQRLDALYGYKDAAALVEEMDEEDRAQEIAEETLTEKAQKLFYEGRAEEAIELCALDGRLVLSGAGMALLNGDGTVRYFGSEAGELSAVEGWTDVSRLAAGNMHFAAVHSDGSVSVLGVDVVGDGKDRYQPTDRQKWTDAAEVAAGGYAYLRSVLKLHGARPLEDNHFTLIARSDGTVDMQPRPNYKTQIFKFMNAWTEVVAVDGGGDNFIALHSDGTASAANRSKVKLREMEPVAALVSGWSDLVRVTADQNGFFGLDREGTLHISRLSGHTEAISGILGMDSGAVGTVILRMDGTAYCTDVTVDLSDWTEVTAVFAGSMGYAGAYSKQRDYYVGVRSDGTLLHYNLPGIIASDPELAQLVISR